VAKVGIVKIRQTTRPSFVSQNYSAKVNISDLGGVNLANVKDNDILVYSSNTGLWEVETSDFSIFLSSADKTNAAYDQANAATILAGIPSHVANSASAYANGAFLAANSVITFTQASFTYANGTAAHSNAVNDTQNTNISFAWNHSNSSFVHTNASFNHANSSFNKANTEAGVNLTQNTNIQFAWNHANSAFESANNVAPQIEPAFTTANGAFAKANNEAGVNATQNTNITTAQNTAQASFGVANSASIYSNGAFASANSASIYANGSFGVANSASIYANGAFAVANSAGIYANGAFAKANNEAGVNATQNTNITTAQNAADAAFIHANASFVAANNVFPQIQPSYNTANAAFIRANNSLNANNGGTITGDLSISGNLSVLGNTFTVSATTIVANDTVILLGAGNYTSDLLDIGISAHYNDGVNAHTGFIRDHGTKEWQLFEGYTGEIGANNDININDPSFKKATLNANLKSQSITLNNQNLQTLINNAYTRANNSLNANTGGLVGGNVIPTTDNTYYLGSETNRWHSLYVGPGSIDLGGLVIQNQGNVLTVSVGNELPTPIAGSDAYARNHVNAAFNFANTTYIETTYAENHANAAFISANNINGIDLTQNNRITYASNHANAAFITANSNPPLATYAANHANASFTYSNTVFTFSNSAFNLANTNYLPSPNKNFVSSAFGDASGYYGGTQNPNLNPPFYATAGDTISFDLSGIAQYSYINPPYAGGFCIRYSANSSNLVSEASSGLTHVSPTGSISTAAGAQGKISGQLFWKIPGASFTIGNAANGVAQFVYQDALHTEGKIGSILVGPPTYILRQFAGAAFNQANAAFNAANTGGADSFARNTANAAFIHANSSFVHANAAFNAANTAGGADTVARNTANGAFAAANSAGNYANAAFLVANSVAAYSNTVDATQNTSISFAWNHANASFNIANQSFSAANNAANVNTTQNTSISFAWNHANAAFISANSISANIANGSSDTYARNHANSSFVHANAAFIRANNSLNANNGGTISANVTINANLTAANVSTQTYIQFGDGTKQYTANAGTGGGGSGEDTYARNHANAAFLYANGTFTFSNNVNTTQNTNIQFAWNHANAAFNSANAGSADSFARNQANASFNFANSVFANVAIIAYNYVAGIGSELYVWGPIGSKPGYSGTGVGNADLNASSPVQMNFGKGWVSLDENHAEVIHGIKSDGTLWGWGPPGGPGGEGVMGDSTNEGRSSPTQIGTSGGWKKVCGGGSKLALKHDGSIWAWGPNASGQLGLNDIVDRSSPVQVGSSTDQSNFTWIDISNAQSISAGIKSNGTLWTWGRPDAGVLGQNQTADARSSPTQVGANTQWQRVQCINGTGDGESMFAITRTRELWSWGSNTVGVLGLNITGATASNRSSPTQVGTNNNWAQISGGHIQVASAIKTDGTLWTWGSNQDGRLGQNIAQASAQSRSSPTQVGARTDWAKVVNGTFAIRKDGTMWGWGTNSSGQVGDNTTISRSSPVQLFATSARSPGQWRSIGASYSSTVRYALRWSDQGVGPSASDLLQANNIITGIN